MFAAVVSAQPMNGVYPVGSGGPGVDSFASVQAAANALNARGLGGDVQFPIAQAIYTGTVALHSVANSRTHKIRFLPKSAGATIDAGGSRFAFSVESTHNVTVQNLRFQGVRDTGSACIRFADSDSGSVWACRMVSDSAQTGLLVERAVNFHLDTSRVEGTMRSSGSRGLDFRDCWSASVRKCSILGTLNTGVSITGGGDNMTMMTGIKAASDTGFRVVNSPRISVAGCSVHDSTDNGLYAVNCASAHFDSCLTYGTHKQAAYFESCDSISSNAMMDAGTSRKAVTLLRCNDCHFMRLTLQSGPIRGLELDHSPGCVIDSLQVVSVNSDTAVGVLLDSSPGCSFRWAELYGGYGTGFSVSRSSGTRFAHAKLHGAAAVAAMALSQSSGVSVQPCSLVCAAPVSVVLGDSCNDDTLARMTILGTTQVGISALNCRGPVVANSCIKGWNDLGVTFRNVQSPRLYYNTIVGKDSAGNVAVDLANVTGAEARDNIVWNRGRYGSTCYDISEAFPFAPGASDNNDLCTSDSGSVARVNETAYATLAAWRAYPATPDAHSLSRDPLFVTGDNYHLSSSSPCRDSGIPIAGFPYDIELDRRDSLSPDIGADEYTPGAVSEAQPLRQPLRFELRGSPTNRGYVTLVAGPQAGDRLDIAVVDVAGRTVLKRQVIATGSQQRVELGNLRSGVYLVRVSEGNLSSALKLVVER
ncbi:MAG TPA: right-handed parallel beta-helix repeat-containing protein [bacterium]|nr:right-handed parallel beta-helix repeat-containing protein [bacterium]